ncbi:DODA-type extradiol aromatic ring-opening family dioxygenase [Vibrio sp.]|uniref:DODA-type extradiol aromatic ring-opening family dioxygenase n=1 Tax=Vibrio sp. TaxID=678 RepID=UPI003D13E268
MESSTILYLSHGGGPMPLLGDEGHREMVRCLEMIAADIPKPDAIIVISAHWESGHPTITSNPNPELIYDYFGFPAESYQIRYPCAGNQDLANEMYKVLTKAGIDARLDPERGLDHGVFIPLKIMYPEADIPCLQLSLLHSLDPAEHQVLGQALAGLKAKNLLIIGSGFSFHNLPAFFRQGDSDVDRANTAFENWLVETCSSKALSESERSERLSHWFKAPGARVCHPREEHLLPLHVCYGAAGKPCDQHFSLTILNRQASMYLWRTDSVT